MFLTICFEQLARKISPENRFWSPEFPVRSSQTIRHSRSDSPRSITCKGVEPSNAGFGLSSTDRSMEPDNFGERVEEAKHLRDIPLICPIRRIAGDPRCHTPSGGSHETNESIKSNI